MKPILKILAVLLLLFNGIGAMYGGWHLITDSTGASIQMPLSLLHHSPFENFFIPGILLILANGIMSFVVIALLLLRTKFYPLAIIAEGCILCGWIVIQVIMLQRVWPLHVVCGAAGIVLIIVGACSRKSNKYLKS